MNEDDVSETESEGDPDDDDGKRRQDAYNKFKERIKKGKKMDKDIKKERLITVVFKFTNTVIVILEEIRKTRLKERNQSLIDFKNALNLYNEVLKGWIIRCVKTPVLTIIKNQEEDIDFVPLDESLMRDKTRHERFVQVKIRVKTILSNLILMSDKQFPQPLMAFMNSFMIEGGFVPYEFLTDFEQDVLDFDSCDSLENFGQRQKMLMIGSFIISQMLIEKILLKPKENGFNT